MSVRRVCCVMLWLVGCQASAKGKINSGADAEVSANANTEEDLFEGVDSGVDDAEPEPAKLPALEESDAQPALLGARHDLFLKPTGSASCRCLAVETGQPFDARFSWSSRVPTIDANRQLIIAFSSRGTECADEPEESLGAAYRGYRKEGADVVVMVEASTPGRPPVAGAIIPRPDPGGQLFIEPVPATLPYGKSLREDQSRCSVSFASTQLAAADPGELEAAAALDEPRVTPEPEALDDNLADPNQPIDESDELERRRNGFYLSLLLGAGYASLSESETDTRFSGLAFDFDLMLGGSPTRGLAVGGVLGAAIAPEPELEVAGQSSTYEGANLNLVRFGAFADYYLVANLHALLELGYLNASLSGRSVPSGAESSSGLAVAAGLGYDFWIGNRWSAGFLGRFAYARLSNDLGSSNLLLPVLAGTLTFH